ncbi:Argininosuccinate synthase [Prochlorococcus marinus str. MIT 9515]|uniref:Argininosuccinate synthase n=1 Tax=Prochlorococcus marinus (strain MIT 9515) TaxID=167542 RepID=ASSY_PROM5|nr:argininosuccinate synthase [Prochlorococcus marinus]A2BZ94.1 RecName: Full=Argininosuccinate synthase; AltName: Full=Citrulline--aspartate ligase [Prochlorococcus marinus str. MIT 9515]ABM73105.1 Argininosuccinate synthase [Prochlorococcus marinus str. MIT 9515]
MQHPKKVVLAYSGGVDTSVCIPYLKNEYGISEVITFVADLGQGDDIESISQKALNSGATKSVIGNLVEDFVEKYAFPAIRANALYGEKYPLSTALARPLIAENLVKLARKLNAGAVAHGCTGKGNDQVRFDLAINALGPDLEIITPAREWKMSREEAILYGEKFGIPAPVSKKSPYSIDVNLLGRSVEAGFLEDPMQEPNEEVFAMTSSIDDSPNYPKDIEITFKNGFPIAIGNESLSPLKIIQKVNYLAGKNGFGRIDMIEDRVVGIKSREIYEAPGLLLLIKAHKELESITLNPDVLDFKNLVEKKWAQLVYQGFWFGPLKKALDGFIDATQTSVNGKVKIRLHKGNAIIIGRSSENNSLYREDLATYSKDDIFDHKQAEGFIYMWGMSNKIWAELNSKMNN